MVLASINWIVEKNVEERELSILHPGKMRFRKYIGIHDSLALLRDYVLGTHLKGTKTGEL